MGYLTFTIDASANLNTSVCFCAVKVAENELRAAAALGGWGSHMAAVHGPMTVRMCGPKLLLTLSPQAIMAT